MRAISEPPADCLVSTAEFRGPGIHHRFDDSSDDYEMDMDQRTRLLGGRAGRIILLGDGTEIVTGQGDDDDVDMEDRGEAEEADSDVEEQVKKGQAETNGESDAARTKREETPAPSTGSAEKAEDTKEESKMKETGEPSDTPEEPKMKGVSDGPATE